MKNHLKKALTLVKKTGDKVIVFDDLNNFDSAYVIMNFDEYEKIVLNSGDIASLTEEELLDKINRDIAVWKSQQEFDTAQNYEQNEEIQDLPQRKPGPDSAPAEENLPRKAEKKRWVIREDIKEGAEEIIEEDRQYLEEITF